MPGSSVQITYFSPFVLFNPIVGCHVWIWWIVSAEKTAHQLPTVTPSGPLLLFLLKSTCFKWKTHRLYLCSCTLTFNDASYVLLFAPNCPYQIKWYQLCSLASTHSTLILYKCALFLPPEVLEDIFFLIIPNGAHPA